MEITYLGNTTIKIKTKTAIFEIKNKITFEDGAKIVDGPGEYDIKEVSILGYKADKNVIYVVEAEGIRILHLGASNHKLSDNLVKNIGNIDICMISIDTNADEAVEVVRQIEPSITIPMDYGDANPFTSALGGKIERLQKLSIKSADLITQEAHVVILEKK